MTQFQDQYDWVVLGDHPGALLSACLASQLGFSVLVLPLAPSLLTTVSSSGQCLDPEPNYLLGISRFGSSVGLLAECLSQLGAASFSAKLIRSGVETSTQILTHGSRMELAFEEDHLFHQLEREFGNEIAKSSGLLTALSLAETKTLSYWRSFPALLVAEHQQCAKSRFPYLSKLREEKTTLSKLYSALIQTREESRRSVRSPYRVWFKPSLKLSSLKQKMPLFQKSKSKKSVEKIDLLWNDFSENLLGLWYAATGTDVNNPVLVDWLHVLSLARTAGAFRGGQTAYRKFLIYLAQRLGAQVPLDYDCRRIFIEDGKLMGVQLADKGRMIGAKAGIIGCSLSQAREYLSFSGKTAIKSLKNSPLPNGWRFTIALTVHAEAIPVGMGTRAIWKEKDAPPLEIEIAHPEDYEAGNPQMRYIFLRTRLPFTQESLSVSYQRLIASRMFRQLTQIFPFLEFHVTRVYPDFRAPIDSANDEFSEVYGFVSIDFIPDNLRILDDGGLGSFTGIKQLYVANNESYPLMGNFGATVAAIESVSKYAVSCGLAMEKKLEDFWAFLE